MELINSIIGFIIAIGILVTFHEYGHFIVARLCNVKVLKFSVGFGKPIIMKKSKETNTEYSVCMIPLGGYVQMLESKTPDGVSNDIQKDELQFCFDKKNVYQRFAIVAAGPIFNLILAVIFFTFTYMNGIGGIKPMINISNDTEKFEIISVNNENVSRWQDVRVEILNNVINNQAISLTLVNSEKNKIKYPLSYNSSVLNDEGDIIQNIGLNIIYPNNEAIIGTVTNKENNKNIKVGDKIISINGTPINSWTDFVKFIHNNPNTLINIVSERENQKVSYDANILNKNNKGFLGISKKNDLSQFVNISYDFQDSFFKAINSTTDYTLFSVGLLF